MGNLAGTLTAEPTTGAVGMLAEMLADVMKVEQVPVDSHFFDELGADSLVMAKFCARARKREDLPSIVDEGHLRASDDQEPGGVVRAGRGRGRGRGQGEPGRDSHPDPAPGSDPGPVGGARQHAAVPRVRGAAGAVLPRVRVGRRTRRRPGLRMDIGRQGLRGDLPEIGGVRRRGLHCPVYRSDPGQVGAHRPVEAPADPYLESGVLPLLDRQDAGQVEPPGLLDRRLAAVRVVPAGAGRQGRPGDGDLLPACAGLHRPARHRPGHGDPQGGVLRLLPGLRGLDPDRPGHHRPERVHRREDRARHQHLDGRRVAARPRLLAAQRPAGAARRALARVPGPAHQPELPEGLGEARQPVPPDQVQHRHAVLSCSSCTCR